MNLSKVDQQEDNLKKYDKRLLKNIKTYQIHHKAMFIKVILKGKINKIYIYPKQLKIELKIIIGCFKMKLKFQIKFKQIIKRKLMMFKMKKWNKFLKIKNQEIDYWKFKTYIYVFIQEI